jgi:hypothetical protein
MREAGGEKVKAFGLIFLHKVDKKKKFEVPFIISNAFLAY